MDSKSIGEIVLSLIIFAALVSFYAYRRTSKNEVAISKSIEDEFQPNNDLTTVHGDPREHQEYYISQGHDLDSSFYEVRQYQEDKRCAQVKAEWGLPWLPGIDREFALLLTGEFSQEQYSRYWQTIFILDCKHYLPSIHKIESAPEETYCFICRGLLGVVKIVSRRSTFPAEGDSIKTREDWMRAVEANRNED